jgi:phytoene synthase
MDQLNGVVTAEECERILARSGRTFHLASRLLPAQMRHDAVRLYAFCRRIDDLADEDAGAGIAPMRGRHFEQMLEALRAAPLSGQAASLGWPVDLEARFPGMAQIAALLTQSIAADMGPRRISDEEALLGYGFGVAGTVGLMMCRILGAPPRAADSALHLGVAMQLTNIARDVSEDLRRDRIYLPSSWVQPAEVHAALAGAAPAPLVESTQRLLDLAEDFYRSADGGMAFLPWRARFSILAAAACYREIGVRVRRDIPASWRARVIVPGRVKAWLVGRAFLRAVYLSVVRPSGTRTLRSGALPTYQQFLRHVSVSATHGELHG